MLNLWWKQLEKKPFGAKPVRIRHVVETAHNAGWSLDECYRALNLTWGFSEAAFETALRRIADEDKEIERKSSVANIESTKQALELNKKESLSVEENTDRLRKLRNNTI
tara:strand:- start:1044 stop:1370 length:327 start_codon:yes stop_codon:yes gene_type:complete